MTISFGLFYILCLVCVALTRAAPTLDRPSRCPAGYTKVDHHCFLYIHDLMTFPDAVTACQIAHGSLVETASEEELERVRGFMRTQKQDLYEVWMGATDIQGQWQFLSKENKLALQTYKGGWSPNWPSSLDSINPGDKSCAVLDRWTIHGKRGRVFESWDWQNRPCGYFNQVLCEVRLEKGGQEVTTTA